MSKVPANNFRLSEALKRLGRPVVFYPSLARLVGIKEAIMLAQLVYWTPRSKNEQGWVYKSAEDLEEETSLTYREQRRARETLCNKGLIEEQFRREEHRLYFRVIPDAVDALAVDSGASDETSYAHLTDGHMAPDETSQGTLPNVISYKETESTSQITPERTAPLRGSQEAKSQVPVEIGERQSLPNLKKLARDKSLPRYGRPTEPLRAELWDPMYFDQLENAFFDSRKLTVEGQVLNCVETAVTLVVLARSAKLFGVVQGCDIEALANKKLHLTVEALKSVPCLPERSQAFARAVAEHVRNAVTNAAAELLEASGVRAA